MTDVTIPLLVRIVTLRNLHPILTHLSNGLTPAAFVLALLSRIEFPAGYIPVTHIMSLGCMDAASYLMMAFVAVVTPLTMITGVIDWKYRYNMKKVPVIQKKAIAAVVGYVFAILYVVSHSNFEYSIIFLGLTLLFFAVTGEYGGR